MTSTAPPSSEQRRQRRPDDADVWRLTPLSQVFLGVVFVMSFATLVVAIVSFAEIREHRRHAVSDSMAHAAADMAANVFRRKKQLVDDGL